MEFPPFIFPFPILSVQIFSRLHSFSLFIILFVHMSLGHLRSSFSIKENKAHYEFYLTFDRHNYLTCSNHRNLLINTLFSIGLTLTVNPMKPFLIPLFFRYWAFETGYVSAPGDIVSHASATTCTDLTFILQATRLSHKTPLFFV